MGHIEFKDRYANELDWIGLAYVWEYGWPIWQ